MHDINNYELYAIIDLPENAKKFFDKQNLIRFKEKWYIHDYVNTTTKKIELEYLEQFEKKYKINLWSIIYSDRIFYKFNKYYIFSHEEILTILEKECKFFEQILDKINPDFVVMKITENQQDLLFHELCLAKKIKILTAGVSRFPSRTIISSGQDEMDESFLDYKKPIAETKTIQELQSFIRRYNKDVEAKINEAILSLDKIIFLSFRYLTTISRKNFKFNFENNGKTLRKVIWNVGSRIIKQKNLQRYLSKISLKSIDESPFIYFPLGYEPERSLQIAAPFYENQIEVLINVAKAIPINYKLYVKDHPKMEKIGLREISIYKKINSLPNVKLISQSIPNEELLRKCSLVITIAGTSGLEAVFFKKPSIVFSDVNYSELSSVYRIKSIEELPRAIRYSLEKEIKTDELNRYVNFLNDNSFEFDFQNYTQMALDSWYKDIVEDMTITEKQIRDYLEKNNSEFEKLAFEFNKKIKQYEQ